MAAAATAAASSASATAEVAILGFLSTNDSIPDTLDFAIATSIDHAVLENTIKSLNGFNLIEATAFNKDAVWTLTSEGQGYVDNGSAEAQLFNAVPVSGSIPPKELERIVGAAIYKIGCKYVKQNGWLELTKTDVSRKVDNIEDTIRGLLQQVTDRKAIDDEDYKLLKNRKLITLQTFKSYHIKKGAKFVEVRKKLVTDLTREHLQSGDWKNLEFKEYNLKSQVQPIQTGYEHPLLKVREAIQSIFLQMGFKEMPTNNFVESSFWNFDALFQPQQHPARDSHDTFFLEVPSLTTKLPEDYVERVKRVHESGGHGSNGYQYEWKREEADKNLLRTHTTAVSTRMLYALAKLGSFRPQKYFSIDRVFRNEAVDKTHLAEFHQIEGLICDRGITHGDLNGTLEEFFSRLGMSKLRFKPAYNPYTQPSMEIFSYHDGLKKWVEIGNSGVFRPEMLLPMGFPEDVNVIAWGLSLERPTMILYGIDNIRDLFGPKMDFHLLKNFLVCRLGMQELQLT